MTSKKASQTQPCLQNAEQLEERTVLSGAAIVQPFSNVDYFGHTTKDWSVNAINAPEAWAQGFTGQDVVIAVIDTGVAVHHEDLAHNIWINDDEIPGNGIDDDSNGFVDDVHGWDFVDRDADVTDPAGHGTAVAGSIVAARNDYGVTGIAYDAQIMVIRVLAEDGVGTQLDIGAGIRYAVANGADIINMSLGGTGSKRVSTAVQYAQNEGVLIVAASGNAAEARPEYPAQYSGQFNNVISVGAFDDELELAAFSNTVGSTSTVQVDAPGYRVYSTSIEDSYRFISGTSIATPHVSAIAALALSANGELTPGEIRDFITDGASQTIEFSDSLGGVNAATTVAFAAASVPQPPQNVALIDETFADATPAITEEQISPLASVGDTDGDFDIDFHDFLVVSRNFGSSPDEAGTNGDLNGDGNVDFDDFLTFARNFGRTHDEAFALEADLGESHAEDLLGEA